METIYFLMFIGVCAFAIVWVTRRSKRRTDLGSRRTSARNISHADKLLTPADNRLAHKNELWEARRNQATKGLRSRQQFIPRFEAAKEAQYDGYSRRDRHHVTPSETVKEEAHIEGHGDFSMSSNDFDSKEHASQT
jgi:hypothetical protein